MGSVSSIPTNGYVGCRVFRAVLENPDSGGAGNRWNHVVQQLGRRLLIKPHVFIDRTEDKARMQLARLHAFTQQFRAPRGVVFRGDGTRRADDAASGVLQAEEGPR